MKEEIQELIVIIEEEKAVLEQRTKGGDEMHNYFMGQLLQVENTLNHLKYLLSKAEGTV